MSFSPPRPGRARGVRQLLLLVEDLLLDEGVGDGPGRQGTVCPLLGDAVIAGGPPARDFSGEGWAPPPPPPPPAPPVLRGPVARNSVLGGGGAALAANFTCPKVDTKPNCRHGFLLQFALPE